MSLVKTVFDITTGQSTIVPLSQSEINALTVSHQQFEVQRLAVRNGQKVDLQTILGFVNGINDFATLKTFLRVLSKQVYRLKFGMNDQEIEELSVEP